MWMSRSTVVRACSSGGQDNSPLATSGQTFSTSVTATTLAASALMGGGSSGSDGNCEPLRPEELQHWTITASSVWTFYREKQTFSVFFFTCSTSNTCNTVYTVSNLCSFSSFITHLDDPRWVRYLCGSPNLQSLSNHSGMKHRPHTT